MTATYPVPEDAIFAKWLKSKGKTEHCVCDYEVFGFAGSVDYSLIYSRECPVHFPESSEILRGEK